MDDILKIKKLSEELKFNLSDSELNQISLEFNNILNQLNLIRDIDTKEVEPTSFTVNSKSIILREDIIIETNKDVFSNCKNFDGEYVVIKNEK